MSSFDIVLFHISCFMCIYVNIDKHSLGPAKLSCPTRPAWKLVVRLHLHKCIYVSKFHDFDINIYIKGVILILREIYITCFENKEEVATNLSCIVSRLRRCPPDHTNNKCM